MMVLRQRRTEGEKRGKEKKLNLRERENMGIAQKKPILVNIRRETPQTQKVLGERDGDFFDY